MCFIYRFRFIIIHLFKYRHQNKSWNELIFWEEPSSFFRKFEPCAGWTPTLVSVFGFISEVYAGAVKVPPPELPGTVLSTHPGYGQDRTAVVNVNPNRQLGLVLGLSFIVWPQFTHGRRNVTASRWDRQMGKKCLQPASSRRSPPRPSGRPESPGSSHGGTCSTDRVGVEALHLRANHAAQADAACWPLQSRPKMAPARDHTAWLTGDSRQVRSFS